MRKNLFFPLGLEYLVEGRLDLLELFGAADELFLLFSEAELPV